jgi:release factor glutamine methyltransferase
LILSSKLVKIGSGILKLKKINTHLLDSEIIMSNLLKKSRESFLINEDINVSDDNVKKFNSFIQRRENHEPIAYIINKKEFWSRNFYVNKNTLIPRPETELLVEKIVSHFRNSSPYILDIGTGSGCILISILEEIKKAKGIGIDISKKALLVAKKNLRNSKIKNRVKFLHKSIDKEFNGKFDLIVSNPPYICTHELKNLDNDIKYFEPKVALDGGNDGLDVIKKIIYKAKKLLRKKGILAIEIGNKQYTQVSKILRTNSFREKYLICDNQKNIRCVLSISEN